MIVAGLQMDIAWEEPERNFRRVEALVGKALELATEEGEAISLLVLPETFATGFSMEAPRVAAFAGETRDFLAKLAREHAFHVLAGYAEPAEPLPANACSIFDPRGEEILHFRKLHPFSLAGEDQHYLAGEALSTAQVDGVRVTPLICYDLRFPEPFRSAASNTDLYCVIANWPAKRRHAWSTLLAGRAIENQAYVLGVNRVGVGGGEPHAGDSALLDPLGFEAAALRPWPGEPGTPPDQGILLGEVDPEEVGGIRARFGFLDDRRPELYARLQDEGETGRKGG